VRVPLFDAAARKRTVSLTLNSDLVEKARAAGLNLSRVAEAAIAAEFRRVDREQWIADWKEAVKWSDAVVAEHGRAIRDWTSEDEGDEDGQDEPDDAADHAA
jgi:antitoxin CcdA